MRQTLLFVLFMIFIGGCCSEALAQTKNSKTQSTKTIQKKDPIVGTYYCKRSREFYKFSSDKTGTFISSGMPVDFTWTRKGNDVTIVYKATGPQKLKFDDKKKTISEYSSIFGTTLVYIKQ